MYVCEGGRELKMKKGFQKAHERSRRDERGKREMSDKRLLCGGNRKYEIKQVRREEKAVND